MCLGVPGSARPDGRSGCSSEWPATGNARVARMPPADLRLAEPPAEGHGPAPLHRREVAEAGGEVAEGDTQVGDLVPCGLDLSRSAKDRGCGLRGDVGRAGKG